MATGCSEQTLRREEWALCSQLMNTRLSELPSQVLLYSERGCGLGEGFKCSCCSKNCEDWKPQRPRVHHWEHFWLWDLSQELERKPGYPCCFCPVGCIICFCPAFSACSGMAQLSLAHHSLYWTIELEFPFGISRVDFYLFVSLFCLVLTQRRLYFPFSVFPTCKILCRLIVKKKKSTNTHTAKWCKENG